MMQQVKTRNILHKVNKCKNTVIAMSIEFGVVMLELTRSAMHKFNILYFSFLLARWATQFTLITIPIFRVFINCDRKLKTSDK